MDKDSDDAVSLPEDFTQHACVPLADSLASGVEQPSVQNDSSELLHAMPEDLAQCSSQSSSQELCENIEVMLPATETCISLMDAAHGSLVDCGPSSAFSEIASEFECGLEDNFTVPSVKAQRVSV